MAELSLGFSKPPVILAGGVEEVRRKQLTRLSENFPAGGIININNPGSEWELDGETITFSSTEDFIERVKIYRNGQLLDTGFPTEDCDVFPVISGPQNSQISFKMFITKNDVIQIWKYILR